MLCLTQTIKDYNQNEANSGFERVSKRRDLTGQKREEIGWERERLGERRLKGGGASLRDGKQPLPFLTDRVGLLLLRSDDKRQVRFGARK